MCEPKQSGSIATSDVNINDVLCGRGTKYCNQLGNKMYHTLVKHFISDYATARNKSGKTEISKVIVDAVRNATPAGRFLTQSKDGLRTWYDIGDQKAREKTSQLLRETVMIGQTNHKTMYQKKKDDKVMVKSTTSLPNIPTSKSIRQSMMASRGKKRAPRNKVSGNTAARMYLPLTVSVPKCLPIPPQVRGPSASSIIHNKNRLESLSHPRIHASHGHSTTTSQSPSYPPFHASHGSTSMPLVHNCKDNSRSSYHNNYRPPCAALHPTMQFKSPVVLAPIPVYNRHEFVHNKIPEGQLILRMNHPPISDSFCFNRREINTCVGSCCAGLIVIKR